MANSIFNVGDVEGRIDVLSEQIGAITGYASHSATVKKDFPYSSSIQTYSLVLTKLSWVCIIAYMGYTWIDIGDFRLTAFSNVAQASGGNMALVPPGTYTVSCFTTSSNGNGVVKIIEVG